MRVLHSSMSLIRYGFRIAAYCCACSPHSSPCEQIVWCGDALVDWVLI